MQIFIGGIGCFWDETEYQGVSGIASTECGYCGGKSSTVNYEQVCGGDTEHIEVVKVTFDPEIISYEKIIKFFYEIHDPTTLNSQGPDFGTQYRSEIFYTNEQQKQIAEKITNDENKKFLGKIVTKISLVKNYCPAEEYHQKYLEKR